MHIPVSGTVKFENLALDCRLWSRRMIDFTIGNDDSILILFADKIPARIKGMFVPTIANAHYQALRISVDWLSGDLLGVEKLDFGLVEPNVHFIRKLDDGYLLLGSRACLYEDGQADQNAWITDGQGVLTGRRCFGDGIQHCLVDKQNRIVTSYFDEGIYGNNGWNEPLGASGLVVWTDEGRCLWTNDQYPIESCCAINIDDQDRLWFYYYSDFWLVRTDYRQDTFYDPEIEGSGGFLIHESGRALLFDGGYNRPRQFFVKPIENDSLGYGQQAWFTSNQVLAAPMGFSFRGSKAIIMDDRQNLHFGQWG